MMKKTKKVYMATKIEPTIVKIDGEEYLIKTPEGCIGHALVFTTKKALRAWHGKNTGIIEGLLKDE